MLRRSCLLAARASSIRSGTGTRAAIHRRCDRRPPARTGQRRGCRAHRDELLSAEGRGRAFPDQVGIQHPQPRCRYWDAAADSCRRMEYCGPEHHAGRDPRRTRVTAGRQTAFTDRPYGRPSDCSNEQVRRVDPGSSTGRRQSRICDGHVRRFDPRCGS